VLPAPVTRPLGSDRRTAATLAAGAVAGCALLVAVDPHEGGRYPSCPTQVLLGIDCPACGTLRGVNRLLHGDLAGALSHNVLLLLAVPLGLAAWWGWVRAAAGRPVPARALPRWAVPAAVVVAVAFTAARNLALPGLEWLDSR
jgi:hypothetical protein